IEEEIEPLYRQSHPGDENLSFGRWGKVKPNIRLKPDILNQDRFSYLEIKPLSLSGISEALIKMGLDGIYTRNFGGAGYRAEVEWEPPTHFIRPMGIPTIFLMSRAFFSTQTQWMC